METKAGLIPYYFDNGVLKMLFMVSSDPTFGGPDPQIAKGNVDDGEPIHHAAVREAVEELGLRGNNCKDTTLKQVWSGRFHTVDDCYSLTIFSVEIIDPLAFDTPHFETAYTTWLTLDEFNAVGRPGHRRIVGRLARSIVDNR